MRVSLVGRGMCVRDRRGWEGRERGAGGGRWEDGKGHGGLGGRERQDGESEDRGGERKGREKERGEREKGQQGRAGRGLSRINI